LESSDERGETEIEGWGGGVEGSLKRTESSRLRRDREVGEWELGGRRGRGVGWCRRRMRFLLLVQR